MIINDSLIKAWNYHNCKFIILNIQWYVNEFIDVTQFKSCLSKLPDICCDK